MRLTEKGRVLIASDALTEQGQVVVGSILTERGADILGSAVVSTPIAAVDAWTLSDPTPTITVGTTPISAVDAGTVADNVAAKTFGTVDSATLADPTPALNTGTTPISATDAAVMVDMVGTRTFSSVDSATLADPTPTRAMSDQWINNIGDIGASDTANVTRGVRFKSDQDLTIAAVLWSESTHAFTGVTMRLWSMATGLAVWSQTGVAINIGDNWITTGNISITANQEYILSTFHPSVALDYQYTFNSGTGGTYGSVVVAGVTFSTMRYTYRSTGDTYPNTEGAGGTEGRTGARFTVTVTGLTSVTASDSATLADPTPTLTTTLGLSTSDAAALADPTPTVTVTTLALSTSDVAALTDNVAAKTFDTADIATLTDPTPAIANPLSGIDAATLADASATIPVALSVTDTATLADVNAGMAFASVDIAGLSEIAVVALPLQTSDTGALLEGTSSVTVGITGTLDTASLVETANAVQPISAAEVVLFTDTTPVIAGSMPTIDAATFTEAFSTVNTGANPAGVEIFVALDSTAALTVAVTATDTATLAEVVTTPITADDAGTLADISGTMQVGQSRIDAATLLDVSSYTVNVSSAGDTATLVDVSAQAQAFTATDIAALADVSSVAVGGQPSGSEMFTVGEAVALAIFGQATDVVLLTDTSLIAQARPDGGSLADVVSAMLVSPAGIQDSSVLLEVSNRVSFETTTTVESGSLSESVQVFTAVSALEAMALSLESASVPGAGIISGADTAALLDTASALASAVTTADGATVTDATLNLTKPVTAQDVAALAEGVSGLALARPDAWVLSEGVSAIALRSPAGDGATLGETVQVLVTFLQITAADVAAMAEGAALQVQLVALETITALEITGRANTTVFAVHVRLLPPAVEVRKVTDVDYLVGGQRDIAVEVITGRKGLTLPTITTATFTLTRVSTGVLISAGTCAITGTTVSALINMAAPDVYRVEFTIYVGAEKVVHRVEVGVAA